MRRVALSTVQPCGIAGRVKPTRARRLPPLFDMTLRIESEPLFDEVLPESIQASLVAVRVCCAPQLTVVLWIVHEAVAGVWSRLPAASFARTENVCWPTLKLVYALGEVHAA